MVNIQLKKFVFLLILLVSSNICIASAQLILFINDSESTLGRPIRAELYGISLKTKITNIKLNHLNENFGIVTDYVINNTADKRWPNQSIQVLKFKLYPRKTGVLLIPGISTDKVRTQNKTIRITEGKTGSPQISLSVNEPYERQQIIAHITVASHDATSRLSIKDNTGISGFESVPLQFNRIKKKNGTYLLQIGWALTAFKSGQLKLEFPPVEYSVSGVSRKQFYLPAQTINIKALPSYLPPTIPVGKIDITSQLSVNGILQSNSIYYWNLKLNAELTNTYSLPAILRQIKSSKQFKFLPVNSKRQIQTTGKSSTSKVSHSIPFKALKSGFLELPEIRLQYFDPGSEKIKIYNYHTEKLFVLSFFWRSLYTILIIFILCYTLWLGYKKWQQFKFSSSKREHALQILQEDTNHKKIRQSIHLLAEAEYWENNLTITQWGELWKNKYQVNNDFEDLINMLSSCFYNSKENCSLNKLKLLLSGIIKHRKKL